MSRRTSRCLALRPPALIVEGDLLPGGDVAPALVREMAGAARSICTIEGELRAREKARRHTARTIPREVVVAYVRELSEEERARFVMECAAMAEGSVMG